MDPRTGGQAGAFVQVLEKLGTDSMDNLTLVILNGCMTYDSNVTCNGWW